MKINGRQIGDGIAPYIIAEIGASHGGSLTNAMALIRAAKEAGADAVKFQCYTPDTITIDCDKPDFILKEGPWAGRKLHELYTRAHTPRLWFPTLISYANEIGITWFSSVFSREDVDFLELHGCPAYKIASMEIGDTELIRYAAQTGKPLLISTGMASEQEIGAAHHAAGGLLANRAFLGCVSGYPSRIEEAALSSFGHGISDHSPGLEIPVAATALGAHIIEKHIKLDCDTTSEDAGFALNASDFKRMVEAVTAIWRATRHKEGGLQASEQPTMQLKRSLYVVNNMKKGDYFTPHNVRSIRPGYGMPPSFFPAVISGSKALCDIERGTALATEMVGWRD